MDLGYTIPDRMESDMPTVSAAETISSIHRTAQELRRFQIPQCQRLLADYRLIHVSRYLSELIRWEHDEEIGPELALQLADESGEVLYVPGVTEILRLRTRNVKRALDHFLPHIFTPALPPEAFRPELAQHIHRIIGHEVMRARIASWKRMVPTTGSATRVISPS